MTKPLALRAIIIVAWLRILISLLVIALSIYFAADVRPQNAFVRGLRTGFVQAAGVSNPARFTAEEAGWVSGHFVPTIVLAALLLLFIRRRKLIAARITEGLMLLFSLGSVGLIISVAVLILLFTPPVVRYFRGASQAPAVLPAPDSA